MRPESRAIEFFDSISHITLLEELDDSSPILVYIGVADLSCRSHVILQILPTARRRKSC
jgi:hypothetical protein